MKLIRVSKDEQADTSPEDQSKVLDEEAARLGMVHAGADIVLEGVTGSVPSARQDIDRVIARKRDSNDFEILLVQDFSRFTRGGIEHGNALKWELAKAGIEVIFVTFGSIGDADHDGIIQGMGFYAAQQQAKSMSYNATRGVMSSRKNGNIPHTLAVPFGIDRLYVGIDGKPRHRIRNLADGTQQMLHPTDEVVLRTFARNPKKGAANHYKRQSDEKIVFVPGARSAVEVVCRIFRQKLLHGDGAYRIAKSLNNEGARSPTGKLWAKDSIDSILRNAVYTGRGISRHYETGQYTVHGDGASPKTVERRLTTVARRKKSHKKFRRREEWAWMEYPALTDYLGDLRELAVQMQEREFVRQDKIASAPQPKQKLGGDRHVESPFLLKDVLRSAQGNHPMTGRRAGSVTKPIRYYAVSRGLSAPKDGSPLSRMIPAEPLEQAVLAVVKDVLSDIPNLRAHVSAAVNSQRKSRDADNQQLPKLLGERAKLQEQITDAVTLGPSVRKLMKEKFEQWESEAAALEERISAAQSTAPRASVDVNASVDAVARQFKQWTASMDGLPPSGIRRLLANLVSRLEVDLVTREVRMELALPEGATLSLDGGGPVCLDKNGLWPSFHQTHRLPPLRIAAADCQGERGRKNVPWCFKCSRRAA